MHRSMALLTILTAVLVGTCLRLGWWQLDRAAYKRELEQRLSARLGAVALSIEPDFVYRAEQRFRAARVRGRYVESAQVYLDNQVQDGKPGARVYAPLRLTGSSVAVLVDRGWVAWPADHGRLPDVPLPAGEVEVRGHLDDPPPRSPYMADAGEDALRGTLWPYLDWARLDRRGGRLVAGCVLHEASDLDDGLVRTPPRVDGKRAMHIGYAVQWFVFAAILFVIYLRLLRDARGARTRERTPAS
jgi:surfeit locus 1 family protein